MEVLCLERKQVGGGGYSLHEYTLLSLHLHLYKTSENNMKAILCLLRKRGGGGDTCTLRDWGEQGTDVPSKEERDGGRREADTLYMDATAEG